MDSALVVVKVGLLSNSVLEDIEACCKIIKALALMLKTETQTNNKQLHALVIDFL